MDNRDKLIFDQKLNQPPQYMPGHCFTIEEWDGSLERVYLTDCFRSGVIMVYAQPALPGGPFGMNWRQHTRHQVSWEYFRSVAREYIGCLGDGHENVVEAQ